jgi:deoxyribonuclease-4
MVSKHSAPPLVGAHMSIAGGLYKSVDRAEAVGATAMQIFTKSNQQWAAKKIMADDAAAFKQRLNDSTVKKVNVHASYLINIGSADDALRAKSMHALIDELERCDLLGIDLLVLHPGAAVGGPKEECIKLIAQSINELFERYEGKADLVLENTAGQGTVVGCTLEQLAAIYKNIAEKKRVGFCIDTCHAFAAGYDLSNGTGYEQFWQEFDRLVGIEKLRVIHCNDSKKECGSRVDRHENIGDGKIGIKSFTLLMNDPRFAKIAKICETPKGEDEQVNDARNIETLKKLAQPG